MTLIKLERFGKKNYSGAPKSAHINLWGGAKVDMEDEKSPDGPETLICIPWTFQLDTLPQDEQALQREFYQPVVTQVDS